MAWQAQSGMPLGSRLAGRHTIYRVPNQYPISATISAVAHARVLLLAAACFCLVIAFIVFMSNFLFRIRRLELAVAVLEDSFSHGCHTVSSWVFPRAYRLVQLEL